MNDDWASYFCRVDDKPASMFLSLGISLSAPLEKLPHMGFISLTMQRPHDNGLSSQDEFETLCAIEDALQSFLETEEACVYVGRCTTDGARDFIYYMTDPSDWEDKVSDALDAFPDYQWTAGTQDEKEWETYFDLLYPDEVGMNVILNDRVRMQLDEHGDDMSVSRPIDHWLYFPTEEDRAAFMAEAEGEGFIAKEADAEPDPEAPANSDNEAPRFGVHLERDDAPEEIDEVTWNLRELAGARGGYYDGWGTVIVSDEEEGDE